MTSMTQENIKLQLEVFQLNKKSSNIDLEKCLEWVKACFQEKLFTNISVIVKRIPENYKVNETFINTSLKNYSQMDISQTNLNSTFQNQLNQTKILNESIVRGRSQQTREYRGDQSISPNNRMLEESSLQHNSSVNRILQDKQLENPEYDHTNKLFNQAGIYFKSKDFENAIKTYLQCLKIIEEDQESTKYLSHKINSLIYLGNAYFHLKQNDESIKFFNLAARTIFDNNLQQQNKSSLFYIFSTLGNCYSDQKQHQETIQYWESSLEYLDDNTDENKRTKGHILNNLGLAYQQQQQYEQSIDFLKKSIEIYKELFGPDDMSVGNRLNNLAESYKNLKQYREALEYFEESLRIKRLKYKSENEKSIANTLQSIAQTYFNIQQPSKALQFFIRASDTFQILYANNDSEEGQHILGNLYNSLGECYSQLQNQESALNYYKKSYEIKFKLLGPEHKITLHSATIYARTLFMTKKFQESKKLFYEILKYQRQTLGNSHIKVGSTLNNLGTVLVETQEYEQACQIVEEALAIFENDKSKIDEKSIEKSKKNLETIKKIIKRQQQQQQVQE